MRIITLQVWVGDDAPRIEGQGVELLRGLLAEIEGSERYGSVTQLTDQAIQDAANGIAQRAYFATVQGFVDDLKDQITAGDITDADAAREYVEQSVDGCHAVIYTHAAMEVCRQSDNDGAYFDDFGTEGAVTEGGIEWSQLAYCALLADIWEEVGDLDALITAAEEAREAAEAAAAAEAE